MLDKDDHGYAVDINSLDAGSQSMVIYATLYGELFGWDLRSPTVAWKLKHNLKKGVITSFCVDAQQSYLALGTSSGYHIAWDLRFLLPIATIEHPSGTFFF